MRERSARQSQHELITCSIGGADGRMMNVPVFSRHFNSYLPRGSPHKQLDSSDRRNARRQARTRRGGWFLRGASRIRWRWAKLRSHNRDILFDCEVDSGCYVGAHSTKSFAARARALSVLQRFPKYRELSSKHIRRIDLLAAGFRGQFTAIHQYVGHCLRDKVLTRNRGRTTRASRKRFVLRCASVRRYRQKVPSRLSRGPITLARLISRRYRGGSIGH